MANFYGFVQGNRGEATRMGSKDSGFRAWAQNMRGRVVVDLWHDRGRDYANVTIDSSTQNYGSSVRINLASFDMAALIEHANRHTVRRHLDKACEEMRKANAAARKLAKVDQ